MTDISPDMRIVHRQTGQQGVVRELGKIGSEMGALVQWLDRSERRDGAPDWALLRNLDRVLGDDERPFVANRHAAAGRGPATARSQSQ